VLEQAVYVPDVEVGEVHVEQDPLRGVDVASPSATTPSSALPILSPT